MIELQKDTLFARGDPVEVDYYGSSAFKITFPKAVSVMIDRFKLYRLPLVGL